MKITSRKQRMFVQETTLPVPSVVAKPVVVSSDAVPGLSLRHRQRHPFAVPSILCILTCACCGTIGCLVVPKKPGQSCPHFCKQNVQLEQGLGYELMALNSSGACGTKIGTSKVSVQKYV